jgi:hypothetical protein
MGIQFIFTPDVAEIAKCADIMISIGQDVPHILSSFIEKIKVQIPELADKLDNFMFMRNVSDPVYLDTELVRGNCIVVSLQLSPR